MIEKIVISFLHAFNGVVYTLTTQLNFRIELFISFFMIILYAQIQITLFEWMIVLMSLGFVLVAELTNTVLEVTCDLISLKYNLQIKHIKDVAAGSVLFCLFIVVVINGVILYNNLLF